MVVHHADRGVNLFGNRGHEGIDGAVAHALRAVDIPVDAHLGVHFHGIRPRRILGQLVRDVAIRRRARDVLRVEDVPDVVRSHLTSGVVHDFLHHLRELDLHAPRQVDAVLALQQVADAALARLGVHADHGLVAPTHVQRIDGQIGHVPFRIRIGSQVRFALGKGLLDGILVRTREARVDEIARIRVTRMNRQLVAILDGLLDLVNVAEVEVRRDALRVEVEREVDDVDVAGPLAVAEEAALHAIGTCHHRKLGCGRPRATVVVRMHREDDRLAPGHVAAQPLDLVGEAIGREVLHRRRAVDDDRPLGRGAELLDDRIDHAPREIHLRVREHLGRKLEAPVGFRVARHHRLDLAHVRNRELLDHLVLGEPENDVAHDRCGRVVEVEDRALDTLERLEGALDERLARGRQHLDPDIVRDQVLLDQGTDEIEIRLRRRGKADLDFLDADLDVQREHAALALDVHRLDQRLIAVTQIGGEPDRRTFERAVGPGALGKIERAIGGVLPGGIFEHGHGANS